MPAPKYAGGPVDSNSIGGWEPTFYLNLLAPFAGDYYHNGWRWVVANKRSFADKYGMAIAFAAVGAVGIVTSLAGLTAAVTSALSPAVSEGVLPEFAGGLPVETPFTDMVTQSVADAATSGGGGLGFGDVTQYIQDAATYAGKVVTAIKTGQAVESIFAGPPKKSSAQLVQDQGGWNWPLIGGAAILVVGGIVFLRRS